MTPNIFKDLTPTSKPNYYVTRSGHVYYKDNDTYTLVKPHTLLAKGVNLKRLIYYAYNPDTPKDLWIRTIGDKHDYSLKNLRADVGLTPKYISSKIKGQRQPYVARNKRSRRQTPWWWRVWHWLVRLVGRA